MRCPLDFNGITQGYSSSHKGFEFGWHGKHNCPVYSCGEGEVIYNQYQKTGGNVIIIRHPNGYCSVYGHLQDKSIKVKIGSKVKEGQQIANMGNTGYYKQNGKWVQVPEHLHFAVYKGKKVMISALQQKLYYKNPSDFINCYDNQELGKSAKGIINHTKKVNAKDGLNIRNQASLKGKVVRVAKNNEEIECYGIKNKEWNIVNKALGYYCYNKYLK